MALFRRKGEDPLAGLDLRLGPGDTPLASCVDTLTGESLVASTHQLTVVGTDGAVVLQRPWHLVDGGSYDNEADVLVATWVDGSEPLAMHVGGHRAFLQAFRERVQASVVITEHIELARGRSVRVVIRKNFAQNRLLDQVLLGPGVRLAVPGVKERVESARQSLREQVGLS